MHAVEEGRKEEKKEREKERGREEEEKEKKQVLPVPVRFSILLCGVARGLEDGLVANDVQLVHFHLQRAVELGEL